MSELLIERMKSGDKSALAEVYKLYREPFVQFGLKYYRDSELLYDIYQDATIALFERAIQGKLSLQKSSLKTYLFSMGKFMLFTRLKKDPPSTELSADHEVNMGLYEEAKNFIEDPDPMVVFLGKSLAKLGEKCRQILELYYYENKSMKEIQLILEYNHPDVVKSQKSRCLKSLKVQFENKSFEN
jgi:RNA polymerase sigma factor (sigma-70 family)